MSLGVEEILDSIVSHAMSTGLFERVNTHEPKNAPGLGLNVAIWAQSIGPARSQSGLQQTTGLVVFNVRIYSNMLQEPQDAIDTNLLRAVDVLMSAYSGDFQLSNRVRNIDLLGAVPSSPGLAAIAGYIEQDKKMYRLMTITLPVVINDIWEQNG